MLKRWTWKDTFQDRLQDGDSASNAPLLHRLQAGSKRKLEAEPQPEQNRETAQESKDEQPKPEAIEKEEADQDNNDDKPKPQAKAPG